ncbi:MAG: aldo/keto reductase [Archangiaceae bacterium]|nr:aldo/keto reductase [Archangiaceae bacterium]
MIERRLGNTGLTVSALGLGCGPLGELNQHDADLLVHTALDMGVTLFDCARSYGNAEERLGRALKAWSGRRVIVTKGGYGVEGSEDWTPGAVVHGIDRALETLGVDTLDVFLLHSCDRERLVRGDLLEPLIEAKQAGKIRAAGYAGDGAALEWALGCHELEVIECSVNLFDQRALTQAVPVARGKGVIAKRAMGNAPWREQRRPDRFDAGLYWDRMNAMYEDTAGRAWTELAVRFAVHAPGVHTALVGTKSAVHFAAAVEAAERGPLPEAQHHEVLERFTSHDAGWEGVV